MTYRMFNTLWGISVIFLMMVVAEIAEGADISELSPVLVTATRSPQELTQALASASVVSQEEIRNTSAQELDDVLRLVPGIDLLGYSAEAQHPTSDSISMRGLGGAAQSISRALVMVDGIPINDPFFSYIQWGRVPLENIDHVEIVRGGGSPLWGNYAEGGVINIITREPSAQETIVDAGGGSYGTYRASGYGAYFPTDKMKLQLFVAFDGTSGFEQVPEYERIPSNVPTSYNTQNVQLKDTFAPTSDLSGHATFNFHHNSQQLETILDENSQDIYTITGDLRKLLANDASLTATAFYSNSHFTTNNSTYFPIEGDLAATVDTLNEIHDLNTYDAGGSLIWFQNLSGWLTKYMIGADLHFISGADHTNHYISPSFSPENVTTDSHGDQLFLGGFLEAFASPMTKMEITASGRLQYLENSNGYDGSVGGIGAVPDHIFTRFDPRVDIRYNLTGTIKLRGAYYESFRAPNIGDQFYTYAAGGFVMLPAPYLNPENLTGGEIGVDYTWGRLFSQFTLYQTNINNYIVTEQTFNSVYTPAGWYVVQNQNIAEVQAQGFEGEINWDIGAGFSSRISYTYADSVVKSNPLDPASVGNQLIDVARNKAAATIAYKDKQGWKIATQGYWVDQTDWANPDHTDPGYPGKISADAHFLLDLSGSYPVNKNVEAYLKLQNLLDRRYIATSYSAPSAQVYGAPFEAFAGMRATF